MLTVQQLQPNVTDIEWLKKNNLKVGCDGDSFVRKYLENVLNFKPENIVKVQQRRAIPMRNSKATIYMLPFLNSHMRKFSSISIARVTLLPY
jgi:hypothetical protein